MIRRVHIANLPTPIEAMPRLSAYLNGPSLFIKRDDLTGLAGGGNKTRKLEFLLADALHQNAKTLISAGAIQSNHCRQVAAAAAKFGMGCILVLSGDPAEAIEGNYLLDKLLGADVVFTTREKRLSHLQTVFSQAQLDGLAPYLIPYGGSNELGALAYAFAFEEMMAQDIIPDWVVFASSSGGTQAGITLGAKSSNYSGSILGISVDVSKVELQNLVYPLVNDASRLMGKPIEVFPSDVLVNDNYIGQGYGIMGMPEIEAIQLFARLEGILLDPVYTGRAAAGMIDLIRNGFFKKEDTVLFWHTGGTPALFAQKYSQELCTH